MKTKILKFGMPLMAFLLAIVFAFATEKGAPVEENALVTGYIMTSGGCTPAPKDCALNGVPICKFGGRSIYKTSDCHDFLYEWLQ